MGIKAHTRFTHMKVEDYPRTQAELERRFSTEQDCRDYLFALLKMNRTGRDEFARTMRRNPIRQWRWERQTSA